MIKIIEFLGLSYETVALESVIDCAHFLEKAVPSDSDCFLVNPQVMKQWVGTAVHLPPELISFLLSRFSQLLVHSLRVDAFDSELVRCLSLGLLQSVDPVETAGLPYSISNKTKHISKEFAGLSFGPVNRSNDHVLRSSENHEAAQQVISIDGRPFMAAVRVNKTDVIFVASESVADLTEEIDNAPLAGHFSRFVPHVMALRYFGGDHCWLPAHPQACIVVDDPLLRKRYGFLKFESLLRLAKGHKFHATIAFIPYNFRRNSERITRMFRENPEYLSLCFHGNDHTEGEFASADHRFLNTALCRAEDRISLLETMTGLHCRKVMVFPQGKFSPEAMRVLRDRNFIAAVNTELQPFGKTGRLTICDLAQPAVLRYARFPLFIRRTTRNTYDEDIAYDAFFGKPVLVGVHHEDFEHPDDLLRVVGRINSIIQDIRWADLGEVTGQSVLTRRMGNGTSHIRAFAMSVRVANHSTFAQRYLVEWEMNSDAEVKKVVSDREDYRIIEVDIGRIRLPLQLGPSSSRTLSLAYRTDDSAAIKLGVGWYCHAFLRRRLSEFRDNYLSRNQRILHVAKSFQRRFLKV
jgi:hypothetical protein